MTTLTALTHPGRPMHHALGSFLALLCVIRHYLPRQDQGLADA